MPICIHVEGDPGQCQDAAGKLDALSNVIYNSGERALQAASSQSQKDWGGGGGDRFRDTIGKMTDGAKELSTHVEDLSKALKKFADDLTAVKSKMTQARGIAGAGGLQTNDDWIADPDPAASDVDKLKQAKAYGDASGIADEARTLEKTAHTELDKACADEGKEAEELNLKPYWIAADAAHRYVEGAVSGARKWSKAADEIGNTLKDLRANIDRAAKAGVPFPDDMAAAAVNRGETALATAEANAASNARLVLGLDGTTAASVAAANPATSLANTKFAFPEGSVMGKLAEKLPYVGVAIAAGDAGTEMWQHPDEAAKIAATSTTSYAAGAAGFWATEATAEAVGGWEGGPVTAVGVPVAVAAAWGAGWAAEKVWDMF